MVCHFGSELSIFWNSGFAILMKGIWRIALEVFHLYGDNKRKEKRK